MLWPHEIPTELEAFYRKFQLGANGKPTATWETNNLTRFIAPYPLTLSWDLSKVATRVTCHQKAADSLKLIFEGILAHYGSLGEVKKARMHLYGGCYEFRNIGGSHKLSMHAYGAAIDLDPENNPRGKKYQAGTGMMPRAVIDIFEAQGWKWGGNFSTTPDCMHFQATS
jgi:hypothetical protein